MKKILYIALSLLVVSATACKKDSKLGEVDLGYLNITSSDVNFDYLGGTGKIVVDTESTVTYELDPSGESWCNVTTAGNVVTIVVGQYSGLQSRSTYITLHANGRSCNVNISQTSIAVGIFGLDTLNCLANGASAAGVRTFDYSPTDDALEGISITQDSGDWFEFTLDQEAGTITINAEENSTNSKRTGEISISTPDQKRTYTIAQYPKDLVVNGADLIVNETAGTLSLNFQSTASRKSLNYGIPGGTAVTTTTNSSSWITLSNNAGTKTISVSVRANTGSSRTGTVTLTAGEFTKTITVTQSAA